MFSRLAHLLLAAAISFAGTSACPRGGACPSMQQAVHKCCDTSATALRASDCCSDGFQLPSLGLGTERPGNQGLPVTRVAVATGGAVAMHRVRIAGTAFRGLAPPGSLIEQHTSLLL
jgi:hypothetical protein